jgi:RNA 2',3'-cyclic 3'-phosphodiesterase
LAIVNYRLFVCIEIPSRAHEALGALQTRLRREGARVSWVAPTNLHLTLVFLGDVDSARVQSISAALEKAVEGTAPFAIQMRGAGAFPSSQRPRVLWVGVSGAVSELRSVHSRITNELAQIGLRGDANPFSPHLTLGRVKDDRDPALRAVTSILTAEPIELEQFSVSEIVLMRSELDPRGARHTPLYRALLAPL